MIKIMLKFKDSVLNTIETDKNMITIGRNISNDIQIDNLSVSKQHAQIINTPDECYIEDLGSTNGTYLNELKIAKEKLKNKDVITIGKHSLHIDIEPSDSKMVPKGDADDTMLLTTEKHKKMLEKQKKK